MTTLKLAMINRMKYHQREAEKQLTLSQQHYPLSLISIKARRQLLTHSLAIDEIKYILSSTDEQP